MSVKEENRASILISKQVDKPILNKKRESKPKKINKIPIDISRLAEFLKLNIIKCVIDKPDKIKISTITAQCPGNQKVDISTIKNGLISNGLLPSQELYKEFKNQITISISHSENRKMSVKIFGTGTVHVCGLPNLNMMNVVLDIVEKLAKKLTGEHIKYNRNQIEACMIVGVISLSKRINLLDLKKTLMIDYNLYVNYEPKQYCGLNAKYKCSDDSEVSMITFSSGKMLISVKKVYQLIEVVEFINKIESKDYLNP